MSNAITQPQGNVQYHLQQDDAGPQRSKRSIDTTQVNGAAPDRTTTNDRRRNRGGMDSLGRGNVL